MDVLLFIFLMLLIIAVVAAWPTWPHTRERWPYHRHGGWEYTWSGLALLLVILILILFWLGYVAVWWPWAAYY